MCSRKSWSWINFKKPQKKKKDKLPTNQPTNQLPKQNLKKVLFFFWNLVFFGSWATKKNTTTTTVSGGTSGSSRWLFLHVLPRHEPSHVCSAEVLIGKHGEGHQGWMFFSVSGENTKKNRSESVVKILGWSSKVRNSLVTLCYLMKVMKLCLKTLVTQLQNRSQSTSLDQAPAWLK